MVVALIAGAAGPIVAGPAVPAGAVTCPTVAVGTGVVTPAPTAGVDWSGCDLGGADLAGATLTNADLIGSNLSGADLSGASARLAEFTDADLSGADADGALLWQARLEGADLTGLGLVDADLRQVGLAGAHVSGIDAAGADLTLARSGGLTGTPAALPPGYQIVAGYLVGPGVSIQNADLTGIDLGGLDLSAVRFDGSTLKGADLSGADLSGAVLAGADVRNADLTGADLSGATSGTTGTTAPTKTTDLTGSTLSGLTLTGADFRGWLGTGVVGTPADPGPCAIEGGSLYCSVGMLRVVTSPPVPSFLSVDDQLVDTWGLQWIKKAVGSHKVCFRPVPGFTAPPCETVDVVAGQTTTVTGVFTPRGYLKVTTSPAVASRISVDGIPRNNWGVYTDLPTGSHEVCFGAVAGFTPPPCQTVTVTAGATTSVTGTFTASPGAPGLSGVGMLRVTTNPPVPSQITVDGNIADTWGLNWLELPPGEHTVCWGKQVIGYWNSGPNCPVVTITAGATTTVNGYYNKYGVFRATTNPPLPATITLNGVPYDDWGVYSWRNIAADDPWIVCFGAVPGYVTPACQYPGIVDNVGSATGTYVPKP